MWWENCEWQALDETQPTLTTGVWDVNLGERQVNYSYVALIPRLRQDYLFRRGASLLQSCEAREPIRRGKSNCPTTTSFQYLGLPAIRRSWKTNEPLRSGIEAMKTSF